MSRSRLPHPRAALALSPVARVSPVRRRRGRRCSRLPATLNGQDFWKLSAELSEPDGFFRSDNLVSNEMFMQRVIPELVKTVQPGRAYLGVGPEQNFTYIAATRPSMAFIVDVRRGNLHLHLMYKAIFELSSRSRRFRVAPVLDEASGRARSEVDGAGDLRRLRRRAAAARGAPHAEHRRDA